jgi:5-methylthioadenosine/S-adenosylhomocysteine deaminase
MARETTYIVSGSHLLPAWRQADVIEDGAALVAGSAIQAISTRTELVRRYPDVVEIHEPNGLIMPGLVNSCSWFDDDWLDGAGVGRSRVIPPGDAVEHYPVGSAPDLLYLLYLQSIAIALKSGTTSWCDVSGFPQVAARAARATGIRTWLPGSQPLSGSSAASGVKNDGAEPDSSSGQKGAPELVSRLRMLDFNATPHTARELGSDPPTDSLLILLPQSEQQHQEFRTQNQATVVQALLSSGSLHPKSSVIPGPVTVAADLEFLCEQGVRLVYCQATGQDTMLHGASPTPIGVHGLGTGCYTGGQLDMFRLMNRVAKIAKVVNRDPTMMSAEETLRAATIGGAEVFGAADAIGSLELGKRADLIVLDLHKPHLKPLHNVVSHLVYAARGGDVKHTIINGRFVMQERRLLNLDEGSLLRTIQDHQ